MSGKGESGCDYCQSEGPKITQVERPRKKREREGERSYEAAEGETLDAGERGRGGSEINSQEGT